jgi:uncharacterized protein YaaQ
MANQIIDPIKESNSLPIDRIMVVVLQIPDEKKTIHALSQLGVYPIQFSTTGGFLGIQNATIFIGFPHQMEEKVLEVVQKNCRQRTEYVSTPLEGTPLPIPLSTPITVGGATIFTLDVEQFEEL